MRSYNKMLACEPPVNKGVQKQIVNGVAQVLHRNTLTPLKVIHGNAEIPAGSTIYVNTNMVVNQKWSAEVFLAKDQSVVFVPESIVLLVESP